MVRMIPMLAKHKVNKAAIGWVMESWILVYLASNARQRLGVMWCLFSWKLMMQAYEGHALKCDQSSMIQSSKICRNYCSGFFLIEELTFATPNNDDYAAPRGHNNPNWRSRHPSIPTEIVNLVWMWESEIWILDLGLNKLSSHLLHWCFSQLQPTMFLQKFGSPKIRSISLTCFSGKRAEFGDSPALRWRRVTARMTSQ